MGSFFTLFLQVFQYYKKRKSRHALKLALVYITMVQALAFLIMGIVLAKFLKSMHMTLISTVQAWGLFVALIIILYFNNWMQFTGRKQQVRKAKYMASHTEDRNILTLWLIPILGIILSVILLGLDA